MKLTVLMALLAGLCAAQPDVQGTTVDALTGRPLAGVHVYLRGAHERYGSVSTAEGKFSMATVPPGDYKMFADRMGYVSPEIKPVLLKSGEHLHDLELKLMPGGSISGRVVDSDGEPVAGLMVTAIRGERGPQAQTNEDGEFHIPALRPGKYLVQTGVRNAGRRPEIRSDGTTEIIYGPTSFPGTVEVKAGAEVSGIEIRLAAQPDVHISGRVTGIPAKQYVEVAGGMAGSARVRDDGRFTLWRVPPGTQTLWAFYTTGLGLFRSAPLEVEVAGMNIDNVELAIVPHFQVSGKVEGWSGGSGRLYYGALGGPEIDAAFAEIAADGTFKLYGPEPQIYRLRVEPLPAGRYVKGGLLDLRGGDPHDSVTIDLGTAAARLSGTVSDGNSPVAGALVALFPEGRHATELRILINAGTDGTFSFSGLAPGKYAILALSGLEPSALAVYDRNLETVDLAEGESVMKDVRVTAR